jgi:hypothetical protein
MTEAEWLVCTDLKAMLTLLKGQASDRKLRLFACAWGRRNYHDARSRWTLEVEEQYADGLARMEALVAAYEAAGEDPVDAADTAHFDPYLYAYYLADVCAAADACPAGTATGGGGVSPCTLLRDLIGNPFRPVTFAPTWRSRTVVNLTESIYRERAFNRLPILADALEAAGCTDTAVLAHCRQPGEHVRGCWVVDLVLAKS